MNETSLQNPNHFWHTHLHCTAYEVILPLVHSSQCPTLPSTTLLYFLLYFWHLISHFSTDNTGGSTQGNTDHSRKEQNKHSLHNICVSVFTCIIQKNRSQVFHKLPSTWAGWPMVLPAETRHVSLFQNLQNSSSAQPAPTQWVPQALSPEVQQGEHKVDHSPPSNAQVDESSYTSTPATCLHGVDNLTFHHYLIEDSLTLQDISYANLFSDQSSHCCSSCPFTFPVPFWSQALWLPQTLPAAWNLRRGWRSCGLVTVVSKEQMRPHSDLCLTHVDYKTVLNQLQRKRDCRMWSSHSDAAEDSSILGCEAVSMDKRFPKFQGSQCLYLQECQQSKQAVEGTTIHQNIKKHPSTDTPHPVRSKSKERVLHPNRTPNSDVYKNRHTTNTTNAAPKNNYTTITLTLRPTGSRMFPLCPPTTRSLPATYCALCHSRGLQSRYWNWHQRVVGVTSRNQQSPSKNSQYQSILHVEWHSTRHFGANANNCTQNRTLTIQSANNTKLLHCTFTDCPVATQIIQMLQPTVMITYLPLMSTKFTAHPVLSAPQSTTSGTPTHDK